jgi:predicted adenylyl cyclase CyaB
MPLNLEIKVRCSDLAAAEIIAKSIPANYSGVLHQTDTYFTVPKGRLKLRELQGSRAELIYYERGEEDAKRFSNYDIHFSESPESLKFVLGKSLGIRSVVAKKRTLYLYGETRIHLDQVEQLGSFIEFEVPVKESEESAQRTLDFLIAQFGLAKEVFLKNSYVDLMEQAKSGEFSKKIQTDVAKS